MLAVYIASQHVMAEDLFYSDLINPPQQLIIQDDGIVFGGMKEPIRFCSEESEYICIRSDAINFSVPKNIERKTSWEFDKAVYSIKRKERFSMLGRGVEVLFIEQIDQENKKIEFLFSEELGLIGFSPNGKINRFFLLENGCGFGGQGCIRK